MSKPRLAIFDFACCEGCQLQIVNLEEEILDLLNVVDPVEWREASSDHADSCDVALVEGSITRPEDEQRLKEIRQRSRVLVALGACAASGGVNRLKNNFGMDEVRLYVYGTAGGMPHLATSTARPLKDFVAVDLTVPGCPISGRELAYALRCVAMGTTPVFPRYPVCVECKMRETACRLDRKEVCMGMITRAGCGAPCPAGGQGCFGCRGLVDEPNLGAAAEMAHRYGRTVEELRHRMRLFNGAEAVQCSGH